MRGVAALGDLLRRRSSAELDVLMVWERVEPARRSRPPSAAVTEKMSDARTTQFWDPDQLVSAALRAAAASDPRWPPAQLPEDEGVIWDSVLLFPAGARWEQRPPAPSWGGGDIIDVIDELDRRLFKPSRMSAAADR